jgi:hypothetical protein
VTMFTKFFDQSLLKRKKKKNPLLHLLASGVRVGREASIYNYCNEKKAWEYIWEMLGPCLAKHMPNSLLFFFFFSTSQHSYFFLYHINHLLLLLLLFKQKN